MLNGAAATWHLATNGIPQGSVGEPVLFNLFLDYLDEETESTSSKSTDNTKLGQSAGGWEGLAEGLDMLDQWGKTSGMRFNKTRGWVLHLATTTPESRTGWGQNGWKGAQQKRTSESWSTVYVP